MLPIAIVSFGLALYLVREMKRAEFHLDRNRPALAFEQIEAAQWGLWGRRIGIGVCFVIGALALLTALDPDGMAGAWRIIGWFVSRMLN